MEKKCTKCRVEKEVSDFPTDNSRKDKLYPWCKDCVNSDWRRRYRENQESRRKHLAKIWMGGDKDRIAEYNKRKKGKWKFKIEAQTKLRNAVKSGKVKKSPCEKCGEKLSQGHHPNYKKPLQVIWLCDIHHKEIHGRTVK